MLASHAYLLPALVTAADTWSLLFMLSVFIPVKDVLLKYREWFWHGGTRRVSGVGSIQAAKFLNFYMFGVLAHTSLQCLSCIATEGNLWLKHLYWNFQRQLVHWIVCVAFCLHTCRVCQPSFNLKHAFPPELWPWWRICRCKIGWFSWSLSIIQTWQPPNFLLHSFLGKGFYLFKILIDLMCISWTWHVRINLALFWWW